MAPIVSPARTGPVWRHLLVPSGVLLVIACYEYCLVQADVVGEGGGGGVGRVVLVLVAAVVFGRSWDCGNQRVWQRNCLLRVCQQWCSGAVGVNGRVRVRVICTVRAVHVCPADRGGRGTCHAMPQMPRIAPSSERPPSSDACSLKRCNTSSQTSQRTSANLEIGIYKPRRACRQTLPAEFTNLGLHLSEPSKSFFKPPLQCGRTQGFMLPNLCFFTAKPKVNFGKWIDREVVTYPARPRDRIRRKWNPSRR